MPSRKTGVKSNKRVYPAGELVEATAKAMLEGKRGLGLRTSPHLGPVTEDDRRLLERIVGLTVEEFNQKIIAKLDVLADKIIDRMTETVDKTPLQSLGFNLAVAIDKRQRLAGQAASGNANVNIQVNNYGNLSKEELIAKLTGKIDVPVMEAGEAPVALPEPGEGLGEAAVSVEKHVSKAVLAGLKADEGTGDAVVV